MKRTLERTGLQRGAAVVELAIMLPFLVWVFVSVVDLGLMMREHQVLQNAAREGARFSIQPRNWMDNRNPDNAGAESRIKNRVVNYCAGEGLTITAADVTIDQTYSITVGSGTAVASQVRVSTQHSFITPGATGLAGGPVMLTGEAVFRNLY